MVVVVVAIPGPAAPTSFSSAPAGTVTGLQLSWSNLAGTIPADHNSWSAVGMSLKTLALTGSGTQALMGSIPATLSLLSNLETLNLRGNGEGMAWPVWGACTADDDSCMFWVPARLMMTRAFLGCPHGWCLLLCMFAAMHTR